MPPDDAGIFAGRPNVVKPHIVPVLTTFNEFSTSKHMNEQQFECLGEYMNLLSHNLARRLFAAFDDDNTGALRDYEFFRGLRTMYGKGSDAELLEDFAFTLLNTEVVDGQRDDRVSQDEINDFLGSFFLEVIELFDTGVAQFEHIFGKKAASIRIRGSTKDLAWADTLGREEIIAAETQVVQQSSQTFVERLLFFLNKKEEEDQTDKKADKKADGDTEVRGLKVDLLIDDYKSWCSTTNEDLRLNVYSWLEQVADAWMKQMVLSPHEREMTKLPRVAPVLDEDDPDQDATQYDGRYELKLRRIPAEARASLAKRYDAIETYNVEQLFNDYSQNGYMAVSEFNCWMLELGVKSPHLRARLFDVFDRSNDRFIDEGEFVVGLQKLMFTSREATLGTVFQAIDYDENGSICEVELLDFLAEFFMPLDLSVNSVEEVLRALLPGAPEAAAICEACTAVVAGLKKSYSDAVVNSLFRYGKTPPGTSEQRLYFSDFLRWCSEVDDRPRDYIDSLSVGILEQLEGYQKTSYTKAPDLGALLAAEHRFFQQLRKDHPTIPSDMILTMAKQAANTAAKHWQTPLVVGDEQDERARKQGGGHFSHGEHISVDSPGIHELYESMNAKAFAKRMAKEGSAVTQPKNGPRIPHPSSTFDRGETRRIQAIFKQISQDGVMTPLEWRRCLREAGVDNELTSLRLFDLFDSSGDRELTAKEFTCGLSDICNKFQKGKTPEEARREFAFRFYDSDVSGDFQLLECRRFLASYSVAATRAIDEAKDAVAHSFGLDKKMLDQKRKSSLAQLKKTQQDRVSFAREYSAQRRILEQKDATTEFLERCESDRETLLELQETFDKDLDWIVEEIFIMFGTEDKKLGWRMDYELFTKFSSSAPHVVDWLTALGETVKGAFTTAGGRNFENDRPFVPDNAALVEHKIVTAFQRACRRSSMMTESVFVSCLGKELKIHNTHFARLLFRLFDPNKNGSITVSEFKKCWMTMVDGTDAERLSLAFKLYDVHEAGYLTMDSLRLFFFSFFGATLDRTGGLCNAFNRWVNGHSTSHGNQKSAHVGIPSHLFVGSARKRKLKIAKLMENVTQGHISIFIDEMVGFAFAFKDPGTNRMTKQLGFKAFMNEAPRFLGWLRSLPAAWMEDRGVEASAEMTVAEAADLQFVIGPEHIGKSVAAVVHQSSMTPRPPGPGLRTNGPGRPWWADNFSSKRGLGGRDLLRPRTEFDRISLSELQKLFSAEVPAGQIFTKDTMTVLLRNRLGIHNRLIIDRLYNMFDVNQDGSLSSAEIATGLLLLCSGNVEDRMKLAFEVFDVGDDKGHIGRDEMRTFLRALVAVSMFCVRSQVEAISEVFGPPPVSQESVRQAKEFRATIDQVATRQLDKIAELLESRAFSDDNRATAITELNWAEFELWYECTPRVRKWIHRIGLVCLDALAPLLEMEKPTAGQRPVVSTYRMRCKLPQGGHFGKTKPLAIIQAFKAMATPSKSGSGPGAVVGQMVLNREQFCAVLNADPFNLHSRRTADQLFALYDVNNQGRVDPKMLAVGFLLLGAGGWEEKLSAVFDMFDTDASGALGPEEISLMLYSFALVCLDIVGASVDTTSDLFGPEEVGPSKPIGQLSYKNSLLRLSHGQLERWLTEIQTQLDLYTQARAASSSSTLFEQSGGGGGLAEASYAWEDLKGWAMQAEGFRRWLDSLGNMFLERLIEYEGHEGDHEHSAPSPLQAVANPQSVPVAGRVASGKAAGRLGARVGDRVVPASVHYRYPSVVTKRYDLELAAGAAGAAGPRPGAAAPGGVPAEEQWHRKRMAYSNPHGEELEVSLHTDHPELLQCGGAPIAIPPHHGTKLQFQVRRPTAGQGRAGQQLEPLEIKLWVHNERLARNEECIVLNVTY